MRRAQQQVIDQTVWKEKLQGLGISRLALEELSGAYYQTDFESLYRRLRFLPADALLNPLRHNMDLSYVLRVLGADVRSQAYRDEMQRAPTRELDNLGNTALHYYALRGDGEMVRYLVEQHRQDFKVRNVNGQSVFNYAIFGKKYSQRNIDYNSAQRDLVERIVYSNDGRKATSVPLRAAAFEYLLQEDPSLIQETHARGGNHLHWAAYAGDRSTLEFLAREKGLDPKIKDDFGHDLQVYAEMGPGNKQEFISFCRNIMQEENRVNNPQRQAGNPVAFFQPEAVPAQAPSPYSKKLQDFIKGIEAKNKPNPDAFEELEIEARDELCCSISFAIPQIPVTLDGRLYDLENLMALAMDENGERSDPFSPEEKFKPSDIQPARTIQDILEAEIKKAEKELSSKQLSM